MRQGSQIRQQLLDLKAKTGWSWERMARELERAMGAPGLSLSTIFRYAKGKTVPSGLYARYLREAIRRVTLELARQELDKAIR